MTGDLSPVPYSAPACDGPPAMATPRLHVVAGPNGVDLGAAEAAAASFLAALGVETTAEGLAETPLRIARRTWR